jgi:hypothetical protein
MHWNERLNWQNKTETVQTSAGKMSMRITVTAAELHTLVKRAGVGALLEIAEKVAKDAAGKAPVDNTPQGAQRRKRQRRNHLNKRIKAKQTKRSTYVIAKFPGYFVEAGHKIKKGGKTVGEAAPHPFLIPAYKKAPGYVRQAIGGKLR